MAKYKYTIMRTDHELGIGVEADEPLPHIAIGNRLIVGNPHLSQDGGTFLKIRDIEMTLGADDPPEVRVVHVVIYAEPTNSIG
jgi:hypothetical protein